MQIEGRKLIFVMNFSVLDFFKFASRMPQIAQILVSTFKIFQGSMPPDPPLGAYCGPQTPASFSSFFTFPQSHVCYTHSGEGGGVFQVFLVFVCLHSVTNIPVGGRGGGGGGAVFKSFLSMCLHPMTNALAPVLALTL